MSRRGEYPEGVLEWWRLGAHTVCVYDGEADTYVYKGKLIFEVDNASGIFGLLDYFRK